MAVDTGRRSWKESEQNRPLRTFPHTSWMSPGKRLRLGSDVGKWPDAKGR